MLPSAPSPLQEGQEEQKMGSARHESRTNPVLGHQDALLVLFSCFFRVPCHGKGVGVLEQRCWQQGSCTPWGRMGAAGGKEAAEGKPRAREGVPAVTLCVGMSLC